jgi:hypothetical protein
MRMLDGESLQTIYQLQLYLLPKEAKDLMLALADLLRDPDANEHTHIFGADSPREISVSIITPRKLNSLENYSEEERRMFKEK